MKRSERIELIRAISRKLSEQEWSLINLTLRQFDLPWTDNWNSGGKEFYVQTMIEDEEDQKLIDLAKHLGLDPFLADSADVADLDGLIDAIERQKALMIAVATGGPRINDVNADYRQRRLSIIRALQETELEDPNPFDDLWDWYGTWSGGDYPTYQSRREFIASLYQDLLERLRLRVQGRDTEPVEPTGWERVDRSIEKIIRSLKSAQNEEDFQAVGLLCREAMISLSQAVYDPKLHPTADEVAPSQTDAKRMLEAYIAAELKGSSNEELRRYARNAYQLALVLQHHRSASPKEAALCVEATRSIVNIIAIIAGQKDL